MSWLLSFVANALSKAAGAVLSFIAITYLKRHKKTVWKIKPDDSSEKDEQWPWEFWKR